MSEIRQSEIHQSEKQQSEKQQSEKQQGEIQREDSSSQKVLNYAGIRISAVPPPAEMERYEILSPGATKMLFELYEEQVRHRIELEKIIVKGDNRRASIGQILSFILVMVVLSGGVILLFRGKDGVGFASIITALATLLVAFFGGAFLRKRERSEVGLRE